MDVLTLGNLIATVLQTAVVAAAISLILGLGRVTSPRIRYATWLGLFVLAAVMPFIQPWPVRVTILSGADIDLDVTLSQARLSGTVFDAAARWIITHPVIALLALGCLVRLCLMTAGLVRLRRQLPGSASSCTTIAAVQSELGTHAAVHFVDGLRQPATCGWQRPVILLPAHLRLQDPSVVRAVLVHELLHVKRRDWPLLVVEEVVRALYWFNPAMWWVVDRVQLSREEVVDAAAVTLAGGRRSYVRALLSFADAPLVPAAPAFAERRHLFTRISRLYEESAMSTRRAAFTALLLVVCATAAAAAAVTTFPISGGEQLLVAPAPAPIVSLRQDPPPPPPPPPPPKRVQDAPPPPPPPPPQKYDLKSVRTVKKAPKLIYEVKPKYPRGAMEADVQGEVELEIDIARDGTVTAARVKRSASEAVNSFQKALDEAAIEAVTQWKFEPNPDGPVTTTAEFTFRLRSGPRKKDRQ